MFTFRGGRGCIEILKTQKSSFTTASQELSAEDPGESTVDPSPGMHIYACKGGKDSAKCSQPLV